MNSHTSTLHDLGQRLWLDNINRQLLTSGTLQRYIQEYAITGLTSNPTIFEHAISAGGIYDDAIERLAAAGLSGEELFFALALEDLTQAADLFRPVHDASNGIDGWVSLEVSPLLAHDAVNTVRAATHLHTQAKLSNLFIKIPGTAAGIEAIEEAIFNGIPVNVTLLFSAAQYLAAANAYLRGMERRQLAGLHLHVPSVASVFVSRWDAAVKEEISPQYHNRLGIAIAMQCYQVHCELLQSQRWHQLAVAGVPPQRLLWASTGTKDVSAPDTMYIEALTAANTINTIPEKTLLAFADHGKAGTALPADGGYAISVLEEFRREGVDLENLAARLQTEGVVAFSDSWHALMSVILEKSRQLEKKNDVAPITPGSASKAGKHLS